MGMRRVREAWAEYWENREIDKSAVYGYLEEVFDLVQKWEKRGVAEKYSLRALRAHDWPIKMKADPYARVIYCTSDISKVTPQTRSKWAKIMQWAAKHKKGNDSFTEFVTAKGGLNECAEEAMWDRLP
jgi:hypothetical protein